jgi:hypothetical protein
LIPDYLKAPESISGKIWGTLKKENRKWIIEGHPYMISVAKRVFPGSRGRERGYAEFTASKRIIGDLSWFMQRFPLKIENKGLWLDELVAAQDHFEKQEKWLYAQHKETPPHKFQGKLIEFQKKGLAFLLHNPRSLLADEMGLGKALPLDSFLLTPDGWISMKHIQIGDHVVGQDGTGKKVIGVYPQGKRPVYQVTFSDGSSAECDKEHIWAVKNTNHRFRNSKYRYLTLNQIMKKGIKDINGNSRHFIPMVSPIQFEKRDLPLHPYVLGCFLGDGCLCIGVPRITTADNELLESVRKLLSDDLKTVKIAKKENHAYDYSVQIAERKHGDGQNHLTSFFREFGLWGTKSDTKFIPEEYRFSSIDDRTQLLQGLLDTDGSVTKSDNVIEYSSSSKRLAGDVKFLVESLGGIARVNTRIPSYTYKGVKKKGKLSYRLTIALPPQIHPFKLKRKAEIYHPRQKYQPCRAIKKIEYVGEKECQCIKIDAEDGLFAMDNCIVTHNTPTSLAWLSSLSENGSKPPYIIVVPPHLLHQWKREINKFLGDQTKVHIIKGLTPYPLPKADIYLIHYLILRGWKNELPEYKFGACVFDEIQELRRSESEKYSAASLLAESIDDAIGLSGTPIYNYGGEMWNVLNILEYHCLGDYSSFSREWCDGYYGSRITNPNLFGEYLKQEGLLLRRMKDDVLDELPPKRRIVQHIAVAWGTYDKLISPVIDQAKKIPEIKDAWERGRESRQAIDQTRRVTGVAKAPYVCAFVKTLLESGEKVLLYGYHHDVMDVYMEDLKEYFPVMISGRQNAKVKDLSQEAFMDGDTDLIIVSLRSGLGLNLQRARCVVFGEMDWSPAIHSQCEDRAHRLGVKDSVLCYYLVCKAGTDFEMLDTLGLKTSQFVGIMGDRPEDEHDKMLAQTDMKDHMKKVIERLQHGGMRKEKPDPTTVERLRMLEKLPSKRDPTSLSEFDELDDMTGEDLIDDALS